MLLLSSCDDRNKTTTLSYYNIDSLLDKQINLLSESRAAVIKSILLNGKRDTIVSTRIDSTTVANDFEIFRKIFSKETFKIQNASDLKSNLTVRTYLSEIDSSKEERRHKRVQIFFYNTPDNLRKIEISYSEGNLMFNSSKRLTMEFEDIYNKVTVINYSISGKQKMTLGDSVNFYIRSDFKII